MSLGTLSQSLAAAEQHADAVVTADEGLISIMPFVERHPQALGDLARALGRDYLAACEKTGAEPDTVLLGRVEA